MFSRIRFCNKYGHLTEDDWMKVLMSDESAFRVGLKTGGRLVRRARGEDRFNPRYTVRKIRISQGVCVWGSFWGTGKTELFIVPEGKTMNRTEYHKVLEDIVVPTMVDENLDFYLEDKAPCHRANMNKDFLEVNKLINLKVAKVVMWQ